MDDLISRQAALELVRALPSWPTVLDNLVDRAQVQTELMMLPAADQKKGKWVQYNEMWGLWECSECGAVIHSESKKDRKEYHAFCGRCGARMEE